MHSEQSGPLWIDVHSPNQLVEYLGVYFYKNDSRFYFDDIRENLRINSYRMDNDTYLPFAARMLTIAAELQFPGIVGHASRHSRHHWRRDFMSPVHLLALGIYMANHTVRMFDNKATILESWDRLYEPQSLEEPFWCLLTAWVRPPNNTFPVSDDFLFSENPPKNILAGRLGKLPVLLPDMSFLRPIAAIPFSNDQADVISQGAFQSQILKPAQRRVFTNSDPELIADLFLNDHATWSS